MALTKLSEFFTPGRVLLGNFPSSDQLTADFAVYIPSIDNLLLQYYGEEMARGTPRSPLPMEGDFMTYLLSWWRLRVEDFNKVYNASIADYEPLENYAMNEQTATARNRAEMESSTDADVKPRISAEYSTTNDDQSAGRMTGYNVGGLLGTTPNPQTDGTENSTTTNKYTETTTLSTDELSVSGNEVETVQHIRHGNIGVQSSQDMLSQEYDVRLRSFLMYFCTCFERECLTGLFDLDGGDWL